MSKCNLSNNRPARYKSKNGCPKIKITRQFASRIDRLFLEIMVNKLKSDVNVLEVFVNTKASLFLEF
jgi:hypothetical protein